VSVAEDTGGNDGREVEHAGKHQEGQPPTRPTRRRVCCCSTTTPTIPSPSAAWPRSLWNRLDWPTCPPVAPRSPTKPSCSMRRSTSLLPSSSPGSPM
jgi:hypothetical protein